MNIEFHKLAYKELDDSAEYYNSLSEGLGAEFIATQKNSLRTNKTISGSLACCRS